MIIENSKTYDVNDVEKIFFRPSFCGKSAEELGIRILYNMPMPTKVPIFTHHNNILRGFSSGWQGGSAGEFEQKEIVMSKLKAEAAYSAESYFSTIYEMLLGSSDINLGDLSGTDLEKAETELFRRAIVESIYATMWYGDTQKNISDYSGFNGIIEQLSSLYYEDEAAVPTIILHNEYEALPVVDIFQNKWAAATDELRSLASEGNLVYFVTSDIYDAYHFYLDNNGTSEDKTGLVNGRQGLSYHGIPIVEIPTHKYQVNRAPSFCILTDRRNFVLALNTADSPEKEIRMWYNPDEMENRQRVVFLAGLTIVDTNLISASLFDEGLEFTDK